MKLLVLAQTPPPIHGQSLMVRALVDGLQGCAEIELRHVNLPLSRNAADIGRIRPGKIWALCRACRQARAFAAVDGFDTLYYVPAPGRRSALVRDWIAMGLCRSAFRRFILHWHAAGLAEWLANTASPPVRSVTRRLLGRADLSIVLAEALRRDAEALEARRIAVVPNGIPDPCPDGAPRRRAADAPFQVAFLGLCSEEKGIFDAAEAVVAANRLAGVRPDRPAFVLAAAGAFFRHSDEVRWRALADAHPSLVRHLGFIDDAAKHDLLSRSDCLCLPTRHRYEAHPLVLLEALAHDLPIITTRWRGIPENLPAAQVHFVEARGPEPIARQLLVLRTAPPPFGQLRRHFLAHFTLEQHLATLKAALLSLRD